MQTEIVYGDLLDQDVEVIVNAWNRSIIDMMAIPIVRIVVSAKRRRANALNAGS